MSSDNPLEVACLDLESSVGLPEYFNSNQPHDLQQQGQANSFGHQSNFYLGNVTLNLNTGHNGDIVGRFLYPPFYVQIHCNILFSNCFMGSIPLINLAVGLIFVFSAILEKMTIVSQTSTNLRFWLFQPFVAQYITKIVSATTSLIIFTLASSF